MFADANGFEQVFGCGHCPKDTECMKALTLAAAADSDEDNGACSHRRPKRANKPKAPDAIGTENPFETLEVEESSDADDEDFVADSSSSSSDETSDIQELTNAEVNSTLIYFEPVLMDELKDCRLTSDKDNPPVW
jgi:hypothetical protein